jgi:hypothetical protein
VTNVGRACLGPCADEGAAVLACGALNGCCQGTNCEPACMQRECMPQLQAVFDCAVDACDEEIRVCF